MLKPMSSFSCSNKSTCYCAADLTVHFRKSHETALSTRSKNVEILSLPQVLTEIAVSLYSFCINHKCGLDVARMLSWSCDTAVQSALSLLSHMSLTG